MRAGATTTHLVQESLTLSRPFGWGVARKGFQFAGVAQTDRELLHKRRRQAPKHAVGREDREAGIVDVGKIHHREVEPLIAGRVWTRLSHHLLVVQTRLISMMAIG